MKNSQSTVTTTSCFTRKFDRSSFLKVVLVFAALSFVMAQETPVLKINDANSKFAGKFYQLLAQETKSDNIFFSPLSAHVVLSLAYQGASGTTAQKFSKCLEVPDKALTSSGYNDIINTLNSIQGVTLHVANKVFSMEGFPLKENFKKVSSELFLSEAQLLDFADNVRAAAVINGWVEEKTKSKIKDLITPDALNSLTRLVLVNAVYFKGNWAHKFSKNETVPKPFYTSKNDKSVCQMMHLNRKLRYKEDADLDAKVLELPYDNRQVSMLVVLPNKIDGIEDLEAKLTNYDLSKLGKDLYQFEVNVALPKFKIETTMDLKNILTKMDLGIIFDPSSADFSEFSDSPEGLYVSKVIQKAFIEVNEEGAEAAAATGMIMMARCMPLPLERVEFVADHPFIIVLSTHQSRFSSVLFAGKVVKPSEQ